MSHLMDPLGSQSWHWGFAHLMWDLPKSLSSPIPTALAEPVWLVGNWSDASCFENKELVVIISDYRVLFYKLLKPTAFLHPSNLLLWPFLFDDSIFKSFLLSYILLWAVRRSQAYLQHFAWKILNLNSLYHCSQILCSTKHQNRNTIQSRPLTLLKKDCFVSGFQ